MSKRTWTDEDLRKAVETSSSTRDVIQRLGLIPAGGNYLQVKSAMSLLKLDTKHFTGQAWRKGRVFGIEPRIPLNKILVKESHFQSFKLKKRLFAEELKKPICERCGWAEQSEDGRIPVELDHINGDRHDNRIENLRILCPNCHSLQPTHRGKNQKRRVKK